MAMGNDGTLHYGEPNDILHENGLGSNDVFEDSNSRSLPIDRDELTYFLQKHFPNTNWTGVDFGGVFNKSMNQELPVNEDSDLISVAENTDTGASVTHVEDISSAFGNEYYSGFNETTEEVLGTDVVDLMNTTLFGNTSTPTYEPQGNLVWLWCVLAAILMLIIAGLTVCMARRRYCRQMRLNAAGEGIVGAATVSLPPADDAVVRQSYMLVPLQDSDNADNVVAVNCEGPSRESPN